MRPFKSRKRVARVESESEGDSEGEDESGSDDHMEGPTHSGRNGRPVREPIYNIDALHDKLEDIAWENVDWSETQAITASEPIQVENIDDDLARELAFYNQALASAQDAIGRFEDAGVPWLRPVDYYAEMIKSDAHMSKVKAQLMHEQTQIEQSEQRRKQREQKLYGKKVQQSRELEKAADKKRQIDQVSKLRKQREKSGFQGELDMDAELENMNKRGFNPKTAAQRFQSNKTANPNKKRVGKDQKYGFGGRKSLKKQNDAYSAADMTGYKRMGPKGGVKKRQGGGGGGKPQRPGKDKRQAGKQRR